MIRPSTSGSLSRPLHVTPSRSLVVRPPPKEAVAPSSAQEIPEVRGISQAEVQTDIDMRNTKAAYASKGSKELIRAYMVFRLCSYDILLRNQKQVKTF